MTNLEKIKLGGAAALTASIATIVHGVNVAVYYSAGVILAGVIVAVVAAGHALADGGLHQTRERREHIDWRVHLPVHQLAVDVDLPLGNVAGQIRNRVGDVVVGHRVR